MRHVSEHALPGGGPVVEIKVRDDGPLKISGPVRVIDATGAPLALPEGDAIVLCRCGASSSKPFCDGSHREAAFVSRVRGEAA